MSQILYLLVKLDKLSFKNAEKKINSLDNKFKNLKKVQNAFLNCFYQTPNTELLYENLNTDKTWFFHIIFYIKYLMSRKSRKAKAVINESVKKFPRNLLLNQLRFDLINNKSNLKWF